MLLLCSAESDDLVLPSIRGMRRQVYVCASVCAIAWLNGRAMHKLGRLVCKSEKRKLTRAVNGDLQGCARDACRRRWWWSEGECAVGTSKATLLTAPQTPILEVKLGWRLPRPAQEVPERSLSSLRQSSECPSYLGDRSPGPKRSHDCPLCEAARRLKGALISSCATYTPLHPSSSSPLALSFTVALFGPVLSKKPTQRNEFDEPDEPRTRSTT